MHAVTADQLDAFANRVTDRLRALGALVGVGAAEVFKRVDDL
jgi:hypothetical protein